MPKLEIKVPHELTQSEALIRIQKFLPELKSQHSYRISDLEESWSGSTGQCRPSEIFSVDFWNNICF